MSEQIVIPNEVRDLANGLNSPESSHTRSQSGSAAASFPFNALAVQRSRMVASIVNTYHSPLDDLTEKDSLPVISQTPSTPIPYPAVRLGQSAPICAICGPFNE